MNRSFPPHAGARTLLAVAAAGALMAFLPGCEGDKVHDSLVIRNVTVVDAANGLRPGLTVVVEGDRIVRVEEGGEAPTASQVIEGTGGYLIPGLWDMHVHLTYDEALIEAMPRLFFSAPPWTGNSWSTTGTTARRSAWPTRRQRPPAKMWPP